MLHILISFRDPSEYNHFHLKDTFYIYNNVLFWEFIITDDEGEMKTLGTFHPICLYISSVDKGFTEDFSLKI